MVVEQVDEAPEGLRSAIALGWLKQQIDKRIIDVGFETYRSFDFNLVMIQSCLMFRCYPQKMQVDRLRMQSVP